MQRRRTLRRIIVGGERDLGSNWYATVGQDPATQGLWEFSVYYRETPGPNPGWYSKRVNYAGFLTQADAEEALKNFIQHEVVLYGPSYQRSGGRQGGEVEIVEVGYRFASRQWVFRIGYAAAKRAGSWRSYYMGKHETAREASAAGYTYWDNLRLTGVGGTKGETGWHEDGSEYK
jgi:hypothetical protein